MRQRRFQINIGGGKHADINIDRAGIESLLACVVADSMTGDRHNSNMELISQGIGNVASVFFGGFSATGAIARTATNIRAGAMSSISAIVHSLFLVAVVMWLH